MTAYDPTSSNRKLLDDLLSTFLNMKSFSDFVVIKIWYEGSSIKYLLTNNPPPEKRAPYTENISVVQEDKPVPLHPSPNINRRKKRQRRSAKSGSTTSDVLLEETECRNSTKIPGCEVDQDFASEVTTNIKCTNLYKVLDHPSELEPETASLQS